MIKKQQQKPKPKKKKKKKKQTNSTTKLKKDISLKKINVASEIERECCNKGSVRIYRLDIIDRLEIKISF